MSKKLVVLEVNELPVEIINQYIKDRPESSLAALLKRSHFSETYASDIEKSKLYPSQTWASMNTGLPFSRHGVYWFNDPKDIDKFYWKRLSEEIKVGVFNSPHSSALEPKLRTKFEYFIPDSFSLDSKTWPSRYEAFQEFNLSHTRNSGRNAVFKLSFSDVKFLLLAPFLGFSSFTVKGVLKTLNYFLKTKNLECLRGVQFVLQSDLFLHLMKKKKADLNIFFINHIAANMHRYWYAHNPGDFEDELYPESWVKKHKMDLMFAVEIFDDFLSKLIPIVRKKNMSMVIVSSMGQAANGELKRKVTSQSHQWVLKDCRELMDYLKIPNNDYEIKAGMVPQYTFEFKTDSGKSRFIEALKLSVGAGFKYSLRDSRNTLTLTVCEVEDFVNIGPDRVSAESLGFEKLEIRDHSSGVHIPEGIFIYAKSEFDELAYLDIPHRFDYLKFAPMILNFYGLEGNSEIRM